MQTATATTLSDLAHDVETASWLLKDDDPARGFMVLLAALPPDEDAWQEVVSPHLDELRRGLDATRGDPSRYAAAGAVGVAALRASRDLPFGSPLSSSLLAAARWCFWLVGAEAH